ncbi:MAG: hypothetical protein ACFCUJ_16620 [Thiotrichales bacterium]
MKGIRVGNLMLLLLPVWGHGEIIEQQAIENPRDFGYVIGDVVQRRLTVQFAAPYQLASDSLPRGGRADHWFELRPPTIDEHLSGGSRRYTLTLDYQLFNAGAQPTRVTLPNLELAYTDGHARGMLLVPEFSLTVTPLTLPHTSESNAFLPLQAPFPPPLRDHARADRIIAATAVTLAVALAWLLYDAVVAPWLNRRKRPFAQAANELHRLRHQPPGPERDRAALRLVHRAFDQTAGRVLLRDDVNEFIARHPRFRPLEAEVKATFERSDALFFEPEAAANAPDFDAIARLCARCRTLERNTT